MTKVNSVGISLPTEMISKIDTERGDIPRSRYILRVLRERNKLKEEGRSSNTTKNNNSQDSPNREVGSLQSSESKSPMSQDIKLTQNLCEGNGCNQRATTELQLNAGQRRSITLYLCDSCVNKFRD